MPFDQAEQFARAENARQACHESDAVLEVLVKARAMIADRSRWCVGSRRHADSSGTVSHCVIGAVEAAEGLRPDTGDDCASIHWLSRFATPRLGYEAAPYRHTWRLANHNNTLGHAATIDMLDRAISARRTYLAERV